MIYVVLGFIIALLLLILYGIWFLVISTGEISSEIDGLKDELYERMPR